MFAAAAVLILRLVDDHVEELVLIIIGLEAVPTFRVLEFPMYRMADEPIEIVLLDGVFVVVL